MIRVGGGGRKEGREMGGRGKQLEMPKIALIALQMKNLQNNRNMLSFRISATAAATETATVEAAAVGNARRSRVSSRQTPAIK